MKKYKELKAGDVRKDGDEVCAIERVVGGHYAHPNDKTCEWRPCTLVGHAILPIDFINARFRRPI